MVFTVSATVTFWDEGLALTVAAWCSLSASCCMGALQTGRSPRVHGQDHLERLQMIFATFLRVHVFLKYMAVDTSVYVSAPGPFGDRGDTPRWGLMAGTAACCTQYIRCCAFSSQYSHSQPSCRPQPRGRWRRRHLSQGHEAGLLTVLFNVYRVCVFQVATGVVKSATF